MCIYIYVYFFFVYVPYTCINIPDKNKFGKFVLALSHAQHTLFHKTRYFVGSTVLQED